jgi:hypothetical protein
MAKKDKGDSALLNAMYALRTFSVNEFVEFYIRSELRAPVLSQSQVAHFIEEMTEAGILTRRGDKYIVNMSIEDYTSA